MSANNWTVCPECLRKAKARKEKLGRDLLDLYGEIPPDRWAELNDECNAPILTSDTLREDYELGILDGEFYVYYSGKCDVCGFEFKYKHEEKV